jgi:hypothetical protein
MPKFLSWRLLGRILAVHAGIIALVLGAWIAVTGPGAGQETLSGYTQRTLWAPLRMEPDGLWSLDREGYMEKTGLTANSLDPGVVDAEALKAYRGES